MPLLILIYKKKYTSQRRYCTMKKIIRHAAIFIVSSAALLLLLLLCSCGSDLDGTWVSREDEDTRIKISGEKVKISYDDFRIEGTYKLDEDANIIFHLTDKNGSKYKITAKLMTDQKNKTITLINPKGDEEVFEK